MDAFTPYNHTEIKDKWLNIHYDHVIRWWEAVTLLLCVLILFGVIMHFFIRRNRRLQSEIEERKNAEEKNRIRLSHISLSANLGLWNFYIQEGTIEVNDVWCHQLGYRPDELRESEGEWAYLIGGQNKWLEMMHPDDAPNTSAVLSEHLSGNSLSTMRNFV